MRFTSIGALGPCVAYMFERALGDDEKRRIETLFPKATFIWRTHTHET